MIKYYNIMLVLWLVLTGASLKLWISSITGGIGGETILESELTPEGDPNGSTLPPPNGSPKPSKPSLQSFINALWNPKKWVPSWHRISPRTFPKLYVDSRIARASDATIQHKMVETFPFLLDSVLSPNGSKIYENI